MRLRRISHQPLNENGNKALVFTPPPSPKVLTSKLDFINFKPIYWVLHAYTVSTTLTVFLSGDIIEQVIGKMNWAYYE